MASPEKKPFSVVTLIIDLAVTAVAFVIFYQLVNSHVPSNDPRMVMLWAASLPAAWRASSGSLGRC